MNLFLCLLVISIAHITGLSAQTSGHTSPVVETPGEVFEGIEERLLDGQSLLRFHVTSSGAFAAELRGDLKLREGNVLSLKASGTFGDQDVELYLESDGTRLTGGNGTQNIDMETPTALREAVVLGLTRMGILHNLARLTTGAIPDHAAEGVGDWLVASEIRSADSVTGLSGRIVFDILVTGIRTASAELEVNASNGLPSRRSQTVRFPGGEMNVVEEYVWEP